MARPSVEYVLGAVREIARVPLFGFLLEHPAVVSFYHGRGYRQLGPTVPGPPVDCQWINLDALAEDPRQAAIEIEADDVRLRLTLDEHFDVIDVELTTG